MPDFDLDTYLNNQLGAPNTDKVVEILKAKAAKVAALEQFRSSLAANTAVETARANSWVGKAGVDPESVAGQAINLAASAYSGTNRMIGDVAGLAVGNLRAGLIEANLSEEEIQAYNRYMRNEGTPDDIRLLNAPKGKSTPLQQIKAAAGARELASSLDGVFNGEDAVQQDRRQKLSQDLTGGGKFDAAWGRTQQGWDALKRGQVANGTEWLANGLGDLIYNAGEAAVKNPGAASEYVAENLPQLLTGAAGKGGRVLLTTSNAGYAAEHYQKGIQKYQADNNGAYPDEATRREMAAWSASLALAEEVGDLSLLKGLKGAGAAEDAVAGARRTMGQRTGAVLADTGKGFGTEAATEGFQTYAEGQATLEPATAKQIYEGTVIGGLAGAGLSGGGRAVGEAMNPNPSEPKADKAAAESRALFDAAVSSGDVTALADPKSKTYDPAAAISALSEIAAASPESREEKLAEAAKILESLQSQRDSLADIQAMASPEGMTRLNTQLAVARQTGDTETAQLIEEELASLAQDQQRLPQIEADLAALEERITQASEGLARFGERQAVPELDLDAEIATIANTQDAGARKAAVDAVMVLSMQAPERVSESQIQALLATDALSEGQRTYLRSINDARVAENQLKSFDKVGEEILYGSADNVGLVDYRRSVGAALAAGSKTLANKALAPLAAFSQSHTNKAQAVLEAWQQFQSTGQTVQVVRNEETGDWAINEGPLLNEAQARKNGAITIHRGTPAKVVRGIQAESIAISSTLNELRSAVALKFETASEGGANVQNLPESREVPAAPVESDGNATGQGATGPTQAGTPGGSGLVEGVPGADGQAEVRGAVAGVTAVDSVDQASPDADIPAADTEGQNQSTENPSINPDGVTPNQEAAEQPSQVDGRLSVLSETSPKGTAYTLRNLVADYFKQAEKPLAQVKDLYSSLLSGASKVSQFLPGAESMSESQKAAIKAFFSHLRKWSGDIQANLPQRKKQEFRFEDMMQFLLVDGQDGKVDVDENAKTAIALAAFTWVADAATSPRYLSNKEINSILGKDAKARVTPAAREALGQAGAYQHVIVESLGGQVIQALGLKAKADAPLELEAKLRVALGLHALKLLEDQGLVTRTTINNSTMAELRGVANENDRAQHHFFAVAREANGDLVQGAQAIWEANRGTKGVVAEMFGAPSAAVLPSLEIITELQKNTSGTSQEVPTELRKILLANQSRPRLVRGDTMGLLDGFTQEEIEGLIGVADESPETNHAVNLPGIQAKNDGLRREYKNFTEWVAEYLSSPDTPFFLPFNVWKQHRVGIATNVVNPQTSKIVRFLVGSPDWKVTIDPTNEAQMTSFWLRVGEGLGVKTERMDNAKAVADTQAIVAQETFAKAVAALKKSLVDKAELSSDERASIVQATKDGGANLHTLDVLIGLAYMEGAQGGPFEVQMMGEVDGVANGTMLNHVLTGAGTQAMLNQGGFFEEGHEHTQYNQWRGQPGNLDVYETTARKLVEKMWTMFPAGGRYAGQIASIWGISGEIFDGSKVTKDGRNLIKNAMNPLAFGSSLDAMVEGMADTFIEQVYSKLESLAKKEADQAAVDAFVRQVNSLITDKKFHVMEGKPIAWHMDKVLHPKAEESIKKIFATTVGSATKELMETEFASFLERRNQLNSMAQATFSLYDAVYRGMREAYVAELVSKGELAADGKGRISDLSKIQEAELEQRLKAIRPVIETSMSQKDSNNSGLLMAKKDRAQSTDPAYRNKTKFGRGIKGLFVPSSKTGKQVEQSSTELGGTVNVTAGPGVAMGSATTHSLDSGISHRTQRDMDVLNIHDAVGAGVGGLADAARLMNKNTWESLLNYSPLEAAHQALAKVIEEIVRIEDRSELSAEALANLSEVVAGLNKKYKTTSLAQLLEVTKQQAHAADQAKLERMKTWASVDQYAYQGGNYEVTEADRKQAADMQAKLSAEVSSSAQKAAEALGQAVAAARSASKTAPQAAVKPEDQIPGAAEEFEQPGSQETLDPNRSSPFGKLGKPDVAPDADLLAFFKANPLASASDVLRVLNKVMGEKAGPSTQLMRSLLPLLMTSLPKDLKVRFVSQESLESEALAIPSSASRGWYVAKGSQSEVYILSPDFKDSALRPEVLVHELVHGALSRVIADPSQTPGAAELVKELEELRQEAIRHVNRSGPAGFEAALSDIQEFVAWGLTNQAFQRQVLTQISVASKTDTNTLVDGMRTFIEKVVALVFKGSTKSANEVAVNGLTVLIQNTAGLFAAAEENTAQAGNSVLSMAAVNRNYSTLDIHAALNAGSVSPAFSARLANTLENIVQKLHGPFGVFKAALMQNQAQDPIDVWGQALAQGAAPFASSVLVSPFQVSEQEAHAMEQVEATVRATLADNSITSRTIYRELVKLYNEMADSVQPSDLQNQAQYDFLFGVELNSDNRSDHLARFAAFGLANEQVNKLLQRNTKVKQVAIKQTFAERLQALFEQALEFFHERLTHTFAGQKADAKLQSLVTQLVEIEAKKRMALIRQANATNVLAPVEAKIKEGADAALKKVVELAGSDKIRNAKSPIVQAAGAMVRVYANDQVEAFMEGINKLRNQHWDERLGFFAGTINYAISGNKAMEALLRFRKSLEGRRKDIITNRAKMAREAFANGGKDMTEEQSASITRVFLRTGLHVLQNQFDLADIGGFLADPAKRQVAIQQLESQLAGFGKFKEHFINKANALGFYKATGLVKDEVLMMNASNIARLYGTPYANRFTGDELGLATETIEKLVALYALGYTKVGDLQAAKAVLDKENQRTDGQGHGVEFVLALHKHLEQESKERLFQGQEALMQHGYTPEITNPNVDVKVANAQEGAQLEAMGYVKVGPVTRDPADPDSDKRALYVMRDGGLQPLLTGIMAYTAKASKGSRKHSGMLNPATATGLENASMLADVLSAKNTGLVLGSRKDLSQAPGSFMAPVVNPQGEIVNWRYLMADSTRDNAKVLERDNRFDRVLGVMAGSIFDKTTTNETNVKAIEALKAQYDADGARNPKSYTRIGPNSKNAEDRETWDMLPKETRDAVIRIWGREGMYVNHGMRDIVFGYRKLSLADAVRGVQERREINADRVQRGLAPVKAKGLEVVEQATAELFTGLVEYGLRLHARTQGIADPEAYAKRAVLKVTQAERMWQELVQETKDLIVVKSISVLVGNVRSNLSLLLLSGVPMKDVLRDHLVALRGATAFQKDSEELDRLETLLASGQTNGQDQKIRRQIALLQDSLSRNPVKELIDAGLMPSIVEDTSADDDIYSYKSKLGRYTERLTDKVHPMVREAANQVYMGRGTKAYQGLRRLTQLSDFMARYTQYQYLVSRKENPLSKEDAIQQASDDFVNYDIPMHRTMQYLDDSGIFMFTKYFLRIQKVITRLVREKPGRVLGAVALDQFVALGPIVLDSSWVHKAGNNPFSLGALQYPGSLDELATVSAAGALVK